MRETLLRDREVSDHEVRVIFVQLPQQEYSTVDTQKVLPSVALVQEPLCLIQPSTVGRERLS